MVSDSSSSSSSTLLGDLIVKPLQSCFLGREEGKDSVLFPFEADRVKKSESNSELPSVVESSADYSNISSSDSRDSSEMNVGTLDNVAHVPPVVDTTSESVASDALTTEVSDEDDLEEKKEKAYSFLIFRMSYLFVTLVIMLADGLQGKQRTCSVLLV